MQTFGDLKLALTIVAATLVVAFATNHFFL